MNIIHIKISKFLFLVYDFRVGKIPKFKKAKELLGGIKSSKTFKANYHNQNSDEAKKDRKRLDLSKNIKTFKALKINTPLDHISENSIKESKFLITLP